MSDQIALAVMKASAQLIAGSWLGGLTLSTGLGLRGPALTGLVLTLAPSVAVHAPVRGLHGPENRNPRTCSGRQRP